MYGLVAGVGLSGELEACLPDVWRAGVELAAQGSAAPTATGVGTVTRAGTRQ